MQLHVLKESSKVVYFTWVPSHFNINKKSDEAVRHKLEEQIPTILSIKEIICHRKK